MADFLQGFLGTQQAGVEARNDVTVAIRNWFANRNPLVTRLPYVPVERVDFQMYTHRYRARSTTLGAAVSSNSQTSLTLADATFLMNHDVLEIVDSATGNVERVQISGDPTSSTTVNVTRGLWSRHLGRDGDDPAVVGGPQLDGQPDRQQPYGLRGQPDGPDDHRRAAHAVLPDVPVPGADRRQCPDRAAQVLPGGIQTPFDFNMTVQLQNMVDDIENCLYYGIAQVPWTAALPIRSRPRPPR